MTDTIPSPPPSEVETSPHHEIPSFVGQSPSNIPSAPPYMQELFEKLNEIGSDVRALNGIGEKVDMLSSALREIHANLDLALNAFHSHQAATDARFLETNANHNQLRSDFKALKLRVEEMERQLNDLIGDGR